MKILVTGANGYVGRALCPLLLDNGYEVMALTRTPWKEPGIENALWCQDISPVLQKTDVVIHLAAIAHQAGAESTEIEALYWSVNVEQTKQLANEALAQGVKRFIFMSSIKVNGEATGNTPYRYDSVPSPEDLYGRSKFAAEQTLHEILDNSATELVIIRPPLIWGGSMKGNLASLLSWLSLGLPLPFASIQNRRDLVSLDNLCSLIRVAIRHPAAAGQTLLVSDGVPRTTGEIIRLVAAAANRPAFLVPCPAWVFKWLGYLPFVGPRLSKLTGNLEVDIEYTCKRLDWQPEKGLAAAQIGANKLLRK